MRSANSLGIRHVQVRLTDEEYAKLEQNARSAGMKLQAYLRHLVTAAPSRVDRYASHPDQHEMLELVLRSDRAAADWITGNLKMFTEAIESRQDSQKRRKAG
jgi:hypothetical protein